MAATESSWSAEVRAFRALGPCPLEGGGTSITLSGKIAAGDVRHVCSWVDARLDDFGAAVVICDLGEVVDAGLAALDTAARLKVIADRRRTRFVLRGVDECLYELITLAGLRDVLKPITGPSSPRSGL